MLNAVPGTHVAFGFEDARHGVYLVADAGVRVVLAHLILLLLKSENFQLILCKPPFQMCPRGFGVLGFWGFFVYYMVIALIFIKRYYNN